MQSRFLEADASVSQRLRIAEQSKGLHSTAAVLAHSGDSWFWLAGLALVWLFGNDYWKERAQLLIIGILITAVVVLAIKFTVRRKRPEGTWGGIYRSTDPHSFPSGHAARAFLIAVIMIGLGPLWLGILLLVWAFLVTLARVAMGVHYLSDVLAGGIAGVIMGILMLAVFA